MMNDMNNNVSIHDIQPLYKKPDGLYVQEIDRTDLPLGFEPTVRHLVAIPPGGISANHRHPRSEAFIGIGDQLTFHWIDEDGAKHSENMAPQGKIFLFVVPPNVPHAITNNSDSPAVLLEYADAEQTQNDVEIVKVV